MIRPRRVPFGDHRKDYNAGEERIALNGASEYLDGARILGAEMIDLRDGKILPQITPRPGASS